MTQLAIASTHRTGAAAGDDLARQLVSELGGATPHAVVVFASSTNDYEALLGALTLGCAPGVLVGCSSAGEFTSSDAGTGMSSAVAIHAPTMQFRGSLARGLAADRVAAAQGLVSGFAGLDSPAYRYRTALVLVDALAGHTEDLIEQLTTATAGMYQFAGGGAGDDGAFRKTHVFLGGEAASDAVVALEILSNEPIGIGARHGWSAVSRALRVTEAADACVVSLNASPTAEAFEEHAANTEQRFDQSDPLPFFLHNVVGVKTDDGYKLRVPLGMGRNGAVNFAAEVPAGATTQIMSTGASNAADAAAEAVRDGVAQLARAGAAPSGALFFDCVATRLRLGQAFAQELDAVRDALGGAPFVGFNSYGQVVRAEGQFSGFHNCTAVVLVFPR